ncbi:DUF3397 domain-containing protein [Lactiplantibacillus modestisalitolerans]|uniref:DUF3397 domain-containing protein n=1 Tax=Lactiplantibacillus modestisalitolerans TaxID=1457219 RepID=A0ABV5WTI0_9LACO|nr:DUF3397 domain-containing protein [Lactiplantibacillus modestisalitolerans]
MKELLTTWYGEVVLLAAVSVVLMGLKRLLQRWWPRRLYLVDFWPPLLLYFTHHLTLQTTDSSLLPYEVMSLMILGIGLTLLEALNRGEILYGRFFKFYWRGVDLMTILIYLMALGFHLLLN